MGWIFQPTFTLQLRSRAVMPWLLLVFLAATGGVLQAVAQADLGFVTIDCGLLDTGYTDSKTTLKYTTDESFIDAGVKGNLSLRYNDPLAARFWNTMRSFPDGTRNCYTFGSLESGLKYLIRAKFSYGNYDARGRLPISFDLYVGVNFWTTVNISDNESAFYAEAILVMKDNFVQVCLVNTGLGTPFINGLDLRPLGNTLYPQANETHGLVLVGRVNFGPSDLNTRRSIRYPDDVHDRMWFPFPLVGSDWDTRETKMKMTNGDEISEAPTAVMQTAITPLDAKSNIEFGWWLPASPLNHTLLRYISIMHFSELERLPIHVSRQFDITVNGELLPSGQAYEPSYLESSSVYSEPAEYSKYSVSISAVANSTLPPIINAVELFSIMSITNLGTDAQDASAIMAIKKNYQVQKNWMGDPCFPDSLAWDGLNCSYAVSKHPIIRSVNMSFSGLSGVISASFANIKNLQYLDLSNNNLVGSIPDELSLLPSLMLIDLSNNQLTGSIPSGLLKRIQDGSLALRYTFVYRVCKGQELRQRTIYGIMFVLSNSILWALFALPSMPGSKLVLSVNCAGIAIQSGYAIFYIWRAVGKMRKVAIGLCAIVVVLSGTLLLLVLKKMMGPNPAWSDKVIATIAASFSTITYLLSLVEVWTLFQENTRIHPLQLTGNLASASIWAFYGFLFKPVNYYVVVTNLTGVATTLIQIIGHIIHSILARRNRNTAPRGMAERVAAASA